MPSLEPAFRPASFAIVGASSDVDAQVNRNFVRPLLEFGFKGRIYPVNPHLTEVLGLRVYSSILEIPEPVDYVVCAIPAPLTPKLMEDCATSGAKVVSLYSAGFSETGDEEGSALESALVERARRGSVRVIGPNCLGIHCPASGITFESKADRQSGHVSFLSQSGGNARDLILVGASRGIRFHQGVSYGNAADLNEADFLDHFAEDADTEVVGAYIEGLKEPRRFFKSLKQAAEAKPVIVLKGGRTSAGARAVGSHTGALAGSRQVWDTLCRQAGAIQVRSLEEMTDALLAFSCPRPPRGRRVGIVGIGGGASVQAADDCEDVGLTAPGFPLELRQELRKFTPAAGVGLGNPIDTAANVYWDPASFARTVELVACHDEVDIVLVAMPTVYAATRALEMSRQQIEAIGGVHARIDKPFAVVLRTAGLIEAEELASGLSEQCRKAGLPVYPSVQRAARAMSHVLAYQQNRAARLG